MRAKQLPSGAWRCRVFIRTDSNGKKIFKSITDMDKKHCEALAAAYADQERTAEKKRTLSKAADSFLELKKPVLSPKTYKEYKRVKEMLGVEYKALSALPCREIKTKHIQKFVNDLHAQHRKAKTIKNYCGFISSVIQYEGYTMPKYELPKEIRKEAYIPTSEEVKRVIELAAEKKPELEIPIMLAAFGTLRRSEICALKWPEDFNGNTVIINKSVVQDENLNWVTKTTKTVASTRNVEIPAFVIETIRKRGYVTKMVPNQITNEFIRLIRTSDLPTFSFHKLRHYSASVALGMGIPLSIVEARGGWEHGSVVLQRIYTHVLEEQNSVETQKINSYFEKLF